ncbi:MAG: AzlC family ABC transporter permease [Chloroflexota bacterium]
MDTITRSSEFWGGVKGEIPILLGVAPFGMLYGALAIKSGLGIIPSQSMSLIVFAGSAQFIAVQLLGAGASNLVILLAIFVINLRHALYSASVAPYIQHLKPIWKVVLAYLLTDEAYAVAITHFQQDEETPYRHWYLFGTGITLWSCWQTSTALGIFIGARLPTDFPLAFVLPLTFIALVVPVLRERATVAAAISASLAGVALAALPYNTGLLLAAALGILVGMWVEGKKA